MITVEPQGSNDKVVTLNQFKQIPLNEDVKAVVIRTLPNKNDKLTTNYTNDNPPFLECEIADYLIDKGIEHLLVDLPSVDQECDGGVLAFHHAFWNVPQSPNTLRTITEFVYVPSHVLDGVYVLELQLSPLKNDASPSRPILYQKKK